MFGGLGECRRYGVRRGAVLFRSLAFSTQRKGVENVKLADTPVSLPDFNTDVNIHEHRLKRPVPKGTWQGLSGLQKRVEGSLIPQTLRDMEEDKEFKATRENLRRLGQVQLTREERKKRQRALDHLNVPAFREVVSEKCGSAVSSLERRPVRVLQLNIGLYCNQACTHCHVESSPRRKEMMSREVADQCLKLLEACPSVQVLDLTGGAPELCEQFRYLVKRGRDLGREVIDRCNLTVLLEPEQEDLVEFLAEHKVHIVASLPCYSAKNVNMQRGSGVFDKSIAALLKLNEAGYGRPGSGLLLDLVYNPISGFLPPEQSKLETKYREELREVFGIEFSQLYTITNMPIKRFADFLYRRGELEEYMELLVRNFNPSTLENLMCRDHVSVSWTGNLYDCDFNQQLEIGFVNKALSSKERLSIFDIPSLDALTGVRANTDNHCFGCTAGMGSS